LLSNVDDKKPPLAVIFGISGIALTADEKRLFQQSNPLGFILFARNLDNPQQVKDLVKSLHDCMGREVPVLIDQEGGRVQRLKPPHWGKYAAAADFEGAFLRNFAKGRQAAEDSAAKMAGELADHGFNVNCAPVLDVMFPETHQAIGDRAFSQDPEVVATLASVMADQFLKKGVVPVIKHIPGQGRAESDSHKDLPVVKAKQAALKKTDYVPYKELLTKAFSEAVWGMVAHVVYEDLDSRDPASCSRKVIGGAIRGDIGFGGLLLSDDICMGALDKYGDAAARTKKVIGAGCDVALHCNGDIAEMKAIANTAPRMTPDAVKRYNSSVAWVRRNFK
jgi:beta-N-acetylhexosaminidase